MKSSLKSRRVGLLILIFILLVSFALCLLSGIFFSIPTRAAELYGPADPNLSPLKLYTQSVILLLSHDQLTSPTNPLALGFEFPINPGDSMGEILTGLSSLNIVDHPRAFRAYLIYTGIDKRIQTGDYYFSPGMSEVEIADALENIVPAQTTISILAGWRMEEIAETLIELGLNISPEAFLEAVNLEEKEGYLFPGSYQVARNISPESLVDLFYQEFLSQITPDLEEKINYQGLTIQQAVTLASIVEREAILEVEMPLIASVFLNRLNLDINLAADPTIQYALGYNKDQQTWWTNPLTLEDLNINSPYNTYENFGLPPGPICNPSFAALQAVATPADTLYLYFRAACDGSGQHLFAETFEDHLGNACPE